MNKQRSTNKRSVVIPMLILTTLFFIFGFVTWLNGPLIPFFKLACELSESQAYFVTFAFYIAYFVMAIPSSWVIEKLGYKNGLTLGLIVIAFGSFLFYPAAAVRTYYLFLLALFVMGTGLAILQTAANPYVVVIGPRKSAASRISILGLANKIAGFLAPLTLTSLVLNNMEAYKADKLTLLSNSAKVLALDNLALQLQTPYMYMGVIILILAIGIKLSPLPEIDLDTDDKISKQPILKQILGALKHPQLALGIIAIMLYVAVEVIAGDTIGSFGKSLKVYGHNGDFYLKLTSFTMTAMIVGYIIGVLFIPKYISQTKALKASGILGIILVLFILILSPSQTVSLFSFPKIPIIVLLVALLGLANALCWPAIWPMALDNLGGYTKIGGALLVMGIIGGAIFPLAYGAIVQAINTNQKTIIETTKNGNQLAYIIMLPGYAYLLFYAYRGHAYRKA